jgi:hypothetical protein
MFACRAGRFRNRTGPDRGRVPRESHSHRTRGTAQLGASVVDVQDVDPAAVPSHIARVALSWRTWLITGPFSSARILAERNSRSTQ